MIPQDYDEKTLTALRETQAALRESSLSANEIQQDLDYLGSNHFIEARPEIESSSHTRTPKSARQHYVCWFSNLACKSTGKLRVAFY